MPGEEEKKDQQNKPEEVKKEGTPKQDDKKGTPKQDDKQATPKQETSKQGTPKQEEKKDGKPEDSKKKEDAKDGSKEETKGDKEKKEDYVNFGGAGDEEDPYANDEETYKDHFRRTFITQDNKKEQAALYTLHDMMIPAGRTAKLVRVPDPNSEDFRITEPLDKLKFVEPTPCIILAGAMSDRAGKVLAGVARAAFRAGA